MSAMEIVLIIMGVVIFLLGYLLPAGKKEPDEEVQLISEDEVRKMVSGEVEGARDKISDIVEVEGGQPCDESLRREYSPIEGESEDSETHPNKED